MEQKLGFDLELLKEANKILEIPLIASGGVGTKEHFYEGVKLVMQMLYLQPQCFILMKLV